MDRENTMVAQYAVVGDPIAHSKSPLIHAQFAEQTGQEMAYDAFAITAGNFSEFVRDFFAQGGAGLNVTLPHKEAAFALCEQLSPRATLAEAVNTLYVQCGKLCGDNTDGPGLVRDLTVNHGISLANKSILVLGAGGAARGALAELVNCKAHSITVLNRTLGKAEAIRDAFHAVHEIEIADYVSANKTSSYDLVINATSLSLSRELPPLSDNWVNASTCCYDMMYADTDTVFVSWAKERGAALAVDGLGMLVEQAAESFYIWRGIRPDTISVITNIRAGL